jgi:hypothetical protein
LAEDQRFDADSDVEISKNILPGEYNLRPESMKNENNPAALRFQAAQLFGSPANEYSSRVHCIAGEQRETPDVQVADSHSRAGDAAGRSAATPRSSGASDDADQRRRGQRAGQARAD